jgi:hypothetical protein
LGADKCGPVAGAALPTPACHIPSAAHGRSRQATFHLIKVREVYPGANQQTVLIGDTKVQQTACWNAGGILADCVAWGNFNGAGALQAATGTSAGAPASPSGISAGKAIRRTIDPGCPTLQGVPQNAGTPPPAPSAKKAAGLNTVPSRKPAARTHDRTPTFRFHSNAAGVRYQCKLDRGPFKACSSPYTTAPLAPGGHTLKVRAVDGRIADPTPATAGFKVVLKR